MSDNENIPKRSDRKNQNEDSWLKMFFQFVLTFAIIFGLFSALFTFVLEKETVSGTSMQTTFESGDNLIALRNPGVSRGDVVIVKVPTSDGKTELYIKRIVGLPGEKLESKNDQMFINGQLLDESYLDGGKAKFKATNPDSLFTNNFETTVPADSYFVMGDNRSVSKDSRIIGPVSKSQIEAKVLWRFWPLNTMRTF
ncbi:signal peptidase I [Holzapfeliella sp. He02]|uniref:Signal peptidase I n=1 Tax=Holzapfeliella saturejae TaxID=3082953 RepID=A0ABU8SGH5_9LACO